MILQPPKALLLEYLASGPSGWRPVPPHPPSGMSPVRRAHTSRAAATGRTVHHLFTGYLVAEAGEIKLLRETFNPLAMAQAQLPNGVADIGPPGEEVHSF